MKDRQIKPLVKSKLPTKFGRFEIVAYGIDDVSPAHLALYTKTISQKEVVDVRIHSECMTGDLFGSTKCDCGEQLRYSMKWIQQHGGVILYLRQEGRGIGLVNKLKAYNLQEAGLNTMEANHKLGFHSDLRSYDAAVFMLNDLGVKKVRLLTNNPEKIRAFDNSGIELVERLPVEIEPGPDNIDYLKTKKDEMGHLFSILKRTGS